MFLMHEKIVPAAQKLVEFLFVEMLVMRIDDMSRNHRTIPRSIFGG
ncbi:MULTISPECIES: hypothetical protein [unclassified Mesorhizobium]|nr:MULTISPECIES: hypothetical protein [unclassified Mesorhizobium]